MSTPDLRAPSPVMPRPTPFPLVLLALGLLAPLAAADPAAEVGEAPPPLTEVGRWLNVEPADDSDAPAWAEDGAVRFDRLRGRVVVLKFWMSWCPGCARVRPRFVAVAADHPDDVLVLGVTIRDDRQSEAEIDAYVAERVPFPVAVLRTAEAVRSYDVGKLPYAVVVDRAGRVAWEGNPLRDARGFEGAVAAAVRAEAPPSEADPGPGGDE